MKLRNFFFAALAATFAFASCEQADPDGGNGDSGAGFTAGDYWVMSGEKVAVPITGTSWWNVENAVDGKGYKDNVMTFVAVAGGYNIKDAEGNYYFVGEYNGGVSNKITAAASLEDGFGVWTVEEQEDGTYKITDVKYNAWLQFTTFGNFGAYTEAQKDAVLPVLVSAQGATDRPESDFESELEWEVNKDNKSYSEKADINAQGAVDVLKLGTSSVVGSATIKVPAGTSKLSYWGVAWKDKQGEATFEYGDNSVTQAFASNTGATGNAPYTMTLTASDSYEIVFSPALTAETVVTITTTAGKTRVILGGFVAE